MYRNMIRETLAKMGRIGTNPRHVEGWMILEFGTLDRLGGPAWKRAVSEAVDCVMAATPEQNERLADSYGVAK